jgi:hypothetical protein
MTSLNLMCAPFGFVVPEVSTAPGLAAIRQRAGYSTEIPPNPFRRR